MLTSPRKPFARFLLAELLVLLALPAARGRQSEPPAQSVRLPGRTRGSGSGMSDGRVHPGQVMLTRDARLKIFDEQQKKHREIPSRRSADRLHRPKEWVEEEWRFKENASDENTSRAGFPSREYTHEITLQNGQKIEGTLSGIVYVRADPAAEPERYLLHKRDKGDPGTDLKSLVYVRSIQLGAKALEEGKRKAAGPASRKASAASGNGRS